MVLTLPITQVVRSMVRVPGSGLDSESNAVLLDLSNVSLIAASVHVPQSLPRALFRSNAPSLTSTSSNPHRLKGERGSEKSLDASTQALVKEFLPQTKSESSNNLKRKYPENEENDSSYSTLPGAKKYRKDNVASSRTKAEPQKTPIIDRCQSQQVHVHDINGQNFQTTTTPHTLLQPVLVPVQNEPFTALQQSLSETSNGKMPCQILIPSRNTLKIGNLQNINATETSSTNAVVQKGSASQILLEELLKERHQLRKDNQALTQRLMKFQSVFRCRDCLQYLASLLTKNH